MPLFAPHPDKAAHLAMGLAAQSQVDELAEASHRHPYPATTLYPATDLYPGA